MRKIKLKNIVIFGMICFLFFLLNIEHEVSSEETEHSYINLIKVKRQRLNKEDRPELREINLNESKITSIEDSVGVEKIQNNLCIKENFVKSRLDNWIIISNYFSSQFVSGSTQKDVDENIVCLMDKIGAEFGVSKPKLMGGHREYGLGVLCNVPVGTIINVSYKNIEYKYQVVESLFCYEDEVNDDFVDVNGVGHLELNTNNDILQIYTCYGENVDGRWFVKATRM